MEKEFSKKELYLIGSLVSNRLNEIKMELNLTRSEEIKTMLLDDEKKIGLILNKIREKLKIEIENERRREKCSLEP